MSSLRQKLQDTTVKSKVPWIINLTLALGTAIMITAMIIHNVSVARTMQIYPPLVQAMGDIESNTTLAHLWFEEAISGDTTITIDQIWEFLDQAESNAQTILDGGMLSLGEIQPLPDSPLRKTITTIQSHLIQFRQITEQRWQNPEQAGIGSEPDQQYDAVFNTFLQSTQQVHQSLEKTMAADLKVFKRGGTLLIVISLITITACVLLINYFFFIQQKNKNQLITLNQQRTHLVNMLEDKNKNLQSFIYTSSHDLKSPLVNISGFGKLLSTHLHQLQELVNTEQIQNRKRIEALLDEIFTEDLSFILQGADKMEILINGLLEVARVGSTPIKAVELDMNEVIDNILANTSYKIQELGARIEKENLPPCVGDPYQINQAFSNLIDNALKYANSSRPLQLKIFCRDRKEHNIYCIEDNGIGIHPDQHEKVFDVFYRLNSKENIKGEGLGLTIVHRIIDRHNGTVWVESEPGRGSKFFIALPTKEMI